MFYKLLHNHWDGFVWIPERKHWPRSWTEVQTKQYQRFKTISLTQPSRSGVLLHEALEQRVSNRALLSTELDITGLASLLYYSAGIKNRPKHANLSQEQLNQTRRFYPSAGARYPLELYIVANKVTDLPPNTYHYNVVKHSLEEIKTHPTHQVALDAFGLKWVREAKCIFLISSVQYRNSIKYRDQGYLMALIECGHLAQNITLNATAMKLGSCPLYGLKRKVLQEILDFDDGELLLYAIVIT